MANEQATVDRVRRIALAREAALKQHQRTQTAPRWKVVDSESRERPVVQPAPDERCPECGEVIEQEWAYFRQDPDAPQKVLKHFSGVVKTAIEPKPVRPERSVRDISYPEDLGHFFHPWCAPRARLPAEVEEGFARIVAEAIYDDWVKKNGRWARLQPPVLDGDLPKHHARVASAGARRVFTFARPEWDRLRAHEGKLVEIELELAVPGSLEEAAAVIAALAAECSVEKSRIEIWPYRENDERMVEHVQDYVILENFARRLNLPMFAERAGTQDSPKLRKHLRQHVFLGRRLPENGRWMPRALVRERIVFMTT